jgi:rhomboid protease GluP
MFALELGAAGSAAMSGGAGLQQTLFNLGAMHGYAIAEGHQYWRLFTAMFLHAGLIHLALNMYALYLFGTVIEAAYGPARFLAIYLVSGLLASVTSFVFVNPGTVAVGASGAIFGLLGAWVAYNYRRRGSTFASANLRWAAILIGQNLVLGFSIPGIDISAHLGGLVAGVLCGALAEGIGPRSTRVAVQVFGFAAIVLVGVGLTISRVAALT